MCESTDKVVHKIIIITFITALDICLELLTSKYKNTSDQISILFNISYIFIKAL